MFAALLLFGKDHIVGIIISIAVLAALAYIGILRAEVSHYKAKDAEYTLQMNAINAQNAALQKSSEEITKKYNGSLDDKEQMILKSSALIAKGIKDDKELNSLRLSNNAVRVFNASKQQASNGEAATPAVKGDASGTSAVVASTSVSAGTSQVTSGTSFVTLADLLTVSNENDSNHLACIATVHEWQNFWADYVKSIDATNLTITKKQ